MKNTFDGLIGRLEMAEEMFSELEDISIEYLKPKSKENKTIRNNNESNRITKDYGTTTKGVTYV